MDGKEVGDKIDCELSTKDERMSEGDEKSGGGVGVSGPQSL